MKFDELLFSYLGEFGRYQRIQLLLVCIPTMMTAMHALSWTFTSVVVPNRCVLPGEEDSTPFDLWKLGNVSVEAKELECRRYVNVSYENYVDGSELKGKMESCKEGYKWDDKEDIVSAMQRFEIRCERKWIRAFIQSLYYVGQFLGSIVFGILGDRIGRKKVFFIAIISQMLCGGLLAFVPHWSLFALLRLLVGFCHPGIFVIAVVIGMELVGPSKRALAGVVTGAFYSLGQVVLGLVAYAAKNYQHIQLAISLPDLIFISYWWLVPESARWLLSKGRVKEADVVLQKAAKMNKVELPQNWWEDVELSPKKKSGQSAEDEGAEVVATKNLNFFDLFKTRKIRNRTLIMYTCWPVVSGVYYGLSINPTFLGGDRYLVFIVAALMEIPGLIIVYFTIDRYGRKLLCTGGFFATSLCLFGTLLIPEELAWLKAVQVVLSKMTITAVYAVMYTFTPELFPTVIRNTALGSCSMMARVGAVSASYVSMLLVEYSKLAAVLLFAAFALLACITSLFLPETMGIPLPETIQDIEDTSKSSILPPCCIRKKTGRNYGETGVGDEVTEKLEVRS